MDTYILPTYLHKNHNFSVVYSPLSPFMPFFSILCSKSTISQIKKRWGMWQKLKQETLRLKKRWFQVGQDVFRGRCGCLLADGSALILNKMDCIIQQNNPLMALTSAQRTGFSICLILTTLLVGLHFAVAGAGNVYYKDDANNEQISQSKQNYLKKDFNQFAAFLIVAAGLTFIISNVLLYAFCTDKLIPRTRHVLATYNLILEFAIAVIVSIEASRTSNRRSLLHSLGLPQNNDLNLYYRLLISDAVITFVLQVVYLVIIYFGTLGHIEHHVRLVPTAADPPITADRLR